MAPDTAAPEMTWPQTPEERTAHMRDHHSGYVGYNDDGRQGDPARELDAHLWLVHLTDHDNNDEGVSVPHRHTGDNVPDPFPEYEEPQ